MRPLTLALSLLLALCAATARAGDRVALVIGMAAYQHTEALDNTVNDARLIGDTLTGIGFDVTLLTDTGAQDLREALDRFAFRAETADLALIYYAGHGVELAGTNFLIPADAQIASVADVTRQAVSLDDFLAAVDKARVMRIVILDSCRNNPFGRLLADDAAAAANAARGGLAPPSPDRGTLVAFAARDGEVALDGLGDNSPFAEALAEKMAIPGLEISLMFRQVRDQVLKSTFNNQEPQTYGSLSGVPFYLVEGNDAAEGTDLRLAWAEVQPDQADQLLALAAQGDTRSMVGLAIMRLNADAGGYDPKAAVELLTRAAEAGSPEGQFELAKLYEQGLGVPPDPARALALYQAAADQDFADAVNDLGFLHYQGALGLPPDPAKAVALFQRAADLRHPQALFNTAALIDDGAIPGRGPEDAARYLYDALRSGARDVLAVLSDRPNQFKPETRQALQRRLKEAGFYDGAIDGSFGPGTLKAVRLAFGLTA
jgi:TPR repeat protein